MKELYKNSFADHRIDELGTDDWTELSIELKRQEFYRFSLRNFNIYYALSTLCAALSPVVLFVMFYFNTPAETIVNEPARHVLKNKNGMAQPSISGKHSNASPLYRDDAHGKMIKTDGKKSLVRGLVAHFDNLELKRIVNNSESEHRMKDEHEKQSVVLTLGTPAMLVDSIQSKTLKSLILRHADSANVSKAPLPRKKVRKIYIIKQDTIVAYDSVKIHPGKLKKRFK